MVRKINEAEKMRIEFEFEEDVYHRKLIEVCVFCFYDDIDIYDEDCGAAAAAAPGGGA